MSALQVKPLPAQPERLPGNHLLLNVLMQSPAAIALIEGKDNKYEFSNPLFDMLVGRSCLSGTAAANDLLGLGIPAASAVLHQVFHTSRPYEIRELAVSRAWQGSGVAERKYFNLQINPVNEPGSRFFRLWIYASEVTDLVRARLAVEEREARQVVAFEAARIGHFDWTIGEESFVYNAGFALIFGFPENDRSITHEQFVQAILPDDQIVRSHAMQESMQTGHLEYIARITRTDQSIRWIQVKGKVFFSEDTLPRKACGAVIDITVEKSLAADLQQLVTENSEKLKAKQEQLRESEDLFEKMIEEVQEYAIILLDNVGNIIRWNQGAEKIKGYSEAEILGKNFRIFYLAQDRQERLPERLLSQALACGRAQQEGWRLRSDGTRFWALTVITAVHNDRQKVVGFSKVTRDLTEKKIAEDKLKEYAAELETRNRELEEFAYIASHDLQEPMRKIQTFIQLMGSDINDAASNEKYLNKINLAAQRMSTLVKGVLHYSRLGNIEELFAETDLNEVFQAVMADFELLVSEKDAVVSSAALPTVRAVPLQMHQLFANFISNSLKFCKGIPRIKINSRLVSAAQMGQISARCDFGCWEIEFADNGIGFEAQYAEQIFAMFRRLNSTNDYPGTGIGLALCKKIMDHHSGFIRAESHPGGAIFRIYLPAIRM